MTLGSRYKCSECGEYCRGSEERCPLCGGSLILVETKVRID